MAKNSSRRSARLGAIQALYQIRHIEADPHQVMNEFTSHHFFKDREYQNLYKNPDLELFRSLVTGVLEHEDEIHQLMADNLSSEWSLDRVMLLMRSLLEVAVFELRFIQETPHTVVFNEYIEVAKFFFESHEVGFVNRILDQISKAEKPS